MVDLTEKTINVLDWFVISVEWVAALGTVGAVLVALGLALISFFNNSNRERKLKSLLLHLFCFELNSISHKTIICLSGIVRLRALFEQKIFGEALLRSIVRELWELDRCLRMTRVAENIDKYINLADAQISRQIVTQLKLYEHQAARLRTYIAELEDKITMHPDDDFKACLDLIDRIEELCEKTFDGVMGGFSSLRRKRDVIKIPEEAMVGLKIKFMQ